MATTNYNVTMNFTSSTYRAFLCLFFLKKKKLFVPFFQFDVVNLSRLCKKEYMRQRRENRQA